MKLCYDAPTTQPREGQIRTALGKAWKVWHNGAWVRTTSYLHALVVTGKVDLSRFNQPTGE